MYDKEKATLEYAKLLMRQTHIAMIDYWSDSDNKRYDEISKEINTKEAEMKAHGMEIPFQDCHVDDVIDYIKEHEND